MKSLTNYSVTLEKLGKRQEAITILQDVKNEWQDEIRVFNNLGIMEKRNGNGQAAEECYQTALAIDENSFFPNYNMGVLKASHFY
jgi:Flp pilus assembly protein TadD